MNTAIITKLLAGEARNGSGFLSYSPELDAGPIPKVASF